MGDHHRSAGNRWLRSRSAIIMHCAVLAVLTLTAMALVTSPAAQAAASVQIVPFEARAADGAPLRGDVFLPDATHPVATVLQLSPYWNTVVKGPNKLQADSKVVRPFVEAGFAVALVSLRGTGGSGGCFQWGSRLDWSDASAVVQAARS